MFCTPHRYEQSNMHKELCSMGTYINDVKLYYLDCLLETCKAILLGIVVSNTYYGFSIFNQLIVSNYTVHTYVRK